MSSKKKRRTNDAGGNGRPSGRVSVTPPSADGRSRQTSSAARADARRATRPAAADATARKAKERASATTSAGAPAPAGAPATAGIPATAGTAARATAHLRIGGMSCTGCEDKIRRRLRKTRGITRADVSWEKGCADITYDPSLVSLTYVDDAIAKLGYQVLHGPSARVGGSAPSVRYVAGMLALIVVLFVALQQFGILNLLVPSQLADSSMGYGMLFVVGLLTSVHCVAMCGGINISQCLPGDETLLAGGSGATAGEGAPSRGSRLATLRPAALYNLGRVVSYTVIGFVLGLVGMVAGGGSEAGVPTVVQGVMKLVAGLLMVLMGVNMLGLFPALRRFTPRLPRALTERVGASGLRSRGPLFVGLLNGLMPCGPLQSMQIVALASGSPVAGAASMLLFSLGTVPLMLGLGSIVTTLGRKFVHQMMTVGAVLVTTLGLAMVSQGTSLAGVLSPGLLTVAVVLLAAAGVVASVPFSSSSARTLSLGATACVALLVLGTWDLWTAPSSSGSAVVRTASGAGSTANVSDLVAGTAGDGAQVQTVSSTLRLGAYPDITVKAGTPVKWTITAPNGSVNACNSRMILRDFGVQKALSTGDNVIEFTPQAKGIINYSCWMGMVHGTITVI